MNNYFGKSGAVKAVVAIFISAFLVLPSVASAVDTGFFFANQTIADNSVDNQDNGWTSNNLYATFSSGSDTADYGFANLNIPVNATIGGVEVVIEGQRNGTSVRNLTAALWNTSNGNAYTTTKTATLTDNDTSQTLGGSTDKWGKTWTVADFADATFKVRVGVTGSFGEAALDAIQVRVHYTVPANQTITVTTSAPASAVYGSTFPVAASASSLLPVAVTTTGGCSVSSGTVTMTSGTNDCVVRYNQAGNASFLAAPEVTQTVTAQKRAITATADDKNKTIGDADPVLTSQITSGSLVGADTLTGTLTRDAGETIGSYAITQGTLVANTSNYALTFVPGTLAITALPNGTLTVNGTVINDDAGTSVLGDFTLNVNGNPVTSGAPNSLEPGAYTVSTPGLAGYTTTIAGNCNASGNVTLAPAGSATCSVTFNDNVPDYVPVVGNLLPNPSFEPNTTGWTQNNWGTSVATFSLVGSAHGGSNAAQITMTNHIDSDAKWFFNYVPATYGQYFTFTEWYKSTVPTEVNIFYTTTGGEDIRLVTTLPAVATWTKFETSFLVDNPATTGVSVAHIISQNGTLTTDDYALVSSPAPLFSEGLVSLTFDDGWESFYTNGVPVLNDSGLKATAYINSEPLHLDWNYYMTEANLLALKNQGYEIGGHSYSHIDLTTPATNFAHEIGTNRSDLQTWGLSPVNSFAYPFGAYNDTVISELQSAGYTNARTVDQGYNFTNTDKFKLKIKHVRNDTTVNEVKGWIDSAKDQKTWLILMFHRIELNGSNCVAVDEDGNPIIPLVQDVECTTQALLDQVADYLVAQNITVPTVEQGIIAMNTGVIPDTIKPVITLTGATPLSIEVGNTYVDQGATALDNINGDISANILTTGAVDVNTLGSYVLTYNVSDTAGNTAFAVTRTVNVVPRVITVTADAKSKVYGDAEPALTYTVTGSLINEADLTGALARVAGEDVGTYAIEAGSLVATGNYVMTFVPGVFTITKAPSVTAVSCPSSVVYTAGAQTPCTVLVTGANGLNLTPDASYLNNTLAGDNTASASYTHTGDANYDGSTDSKTFSITKAQVVPSVTANSKVYDTNTTATLSTQTLAGVLNPDVVTLNVGASAFDNKNVGTTKTVTATGLTLGGADSANYELSAIEATANADITAKDLVVTATGVNKVYDATTIATVGLSTDALLGDDVTASYVSASFVDANIGVAKTVTATGVAITGADAGNYTLTNITALASADITVKAITVTADAQSKVYGEIDPATLTYQISEALSGADVFSGTLSREVGENVGEYEIGQNDLSLSSNYTLTFLPGTLTITAKPLTVTVTAGQSKVYGSADSVFAYTNGSLIGPDTLSGSLSRVAGETVGNYAIEQGSVTAGTNYTINFTGADFAITPATVVASVTANGKVYDSNTDATLSAKTLSGVLNSDAVALESASASFDNKNVGTGKTVTASGLSLSGADAGNYTLSGVIEVTTTADVTAKDLIVSALGQNKPYDGNTTATVVLSSDKIGSDDVVPSNTTAFFADANVGTGKAVTVNGISISGADATNYTLTNTTANTTADIITINFTVTADAKSKVYGEVNPVFTGVITGVLLGDDVTATYASLADETSIVGGHDIIPTLSGAGLVNYGTPTITNGTLTVTAAPISVTADNKSKVYGATNPEFTGVITGIVNGDDITASYSSVADETTAVGTSPIVPVLSGALLGNYSQTVNNGNLEITSATLVPSVTANSKVYDTTTAATLATQTVDGVLNADTPALQISSVSFADANVGVAKTVTASGLSLTGVGAGNYVLSATEVTATADITKADQTITFGSLVDRTTNDTPFNVSASASSLLPVSFSIVSGPATVSGNAVSITGAGVITVQASQTGDSNYNAAANVDQSFLASIAPTVTINSAPVEFINTNVGTVDFSVSGDYTTLTCKLNAGAPAPCTVGSIVLDTLLLEGLNTFTIIATDALGNDDEKTASFTLDTTAPVVNLLTSPEDPTGDTTPDTTFTVTDATAVTTECSTDNGVTFVPCASPFTPALTDGEYTIVVRATDAAANVGSSIPVMFTVDSTLPEVEIAPVTAIVDTPDVEVTFTAEEGATLTCELDSSAFTPCESPASLTALSEGTHTFKVTATDAALNSASDSVTFTVDLTAPVITVTGADPLEVNFGSTFTDLGATASDNVDVSVTVVVGGIDAVNTSAPVDTTFMITYNAVDTAGNNAIEKTRTVVIKDLAGPVIVFPEGTDTVQLSLGTAFIIPGVSATDLVDGAVAVSTSTITFTDDVVTNEATTTVETAVKGTYIVTYSATDAHGNSSTKVRTVVVSDLVLSAQTSANVSSNSITITWTTTHPATSRVVYGTVSVTDASSTEVGAPNYGYPSSTIENPALVTNHSVVVSGLSASTVYFFRPVSHGSPETAGGEVSATTSATPVVVSSGGGGGGGGFSYIGDVRINDGAVQSTSTFVTLNLYGSGLQQMQISNTGTFTGIWIPFQSKYAWLLPSGDGVKTVYVRFGSGSSTMAQAQDTIQLIGSGTVAPTSTPVTTGGTVLGATTQSCYVFTKNLGLGSTGGDVTALQTRLTADGLYNGPITGYFGPKTMVAVKAFQTKNGLEAVGIVGPKTRVALNACGGTPVAKTEVPAGNVLGTSTYVFTKTLMLGSTGTEVTELQNRLTKEGVYTGPISGYFGVLTQAAVKSYQSAHGLDPVGIVGPKTRAELNK